ncbi:MAG: hypothetical protein N3D09_00900 [Archaeoglobaceae archaeon]|nr:hypothetical protein [Archaeoglobaceae archaeon]
MVVIVGAGYSGILCAEKLISIGYNVRIFDFKKPGGELAIFEKISELKENYSRFIEEMRAAIDGVKVEKGCVISTNPIKVLKPGGVEIINDRAIIATGAVDRNPWVFGKRPAGIFSPETAIKLISDGYKIGKKFLLAGEDKILDLLDSVLSKNFEVERIKSTDVFVCGEKRVEKVYSEGVEFKCDTLILFRGRKTFNPRNLSGEFVGNAVVCGYDYFLIKKSVEELINLKYRGK